MSSAKAGTPQTHRTRKHTQNTKPQTKKLRTSPSRQIPHDTPIRNKILQPCCYTQRNLDAVAHAQWIVETTQLNFGCGAASLLSSMTPPQPSNPTPTPPRRPKAHIAFPSSRSCQVRSGSDAPQHARAAGSRVRFLPVTHWIARPRRRCSGAAATAAKVPAAASGSGGSPVPPSPVR